MDTLILNFLSSSSTLILLIIIAITLFALGKGADLLVDEAVSLSVHLGIPKLVIGATIVSLGTTLPEATVSVLAAIKGNPDLALGNAIGSIIVNTSLIIGLAALIGRLPAEQKTIKRQGRIKFLTGILIVVVSLPYFSNGVTGNIPQWMGWVFILLLISYIYASIRWAKTSKSDEAAVDEGVYVEEKSPLLLQILKLALGIGLVILSSRLLIPSVEITAIRIGIPQSVIAATLVALGTSLPELVTAITAVKKGHGELAVGNIVGADILNVLFVVGSAAAVTKNGLNVPSNFYSLQFPTMLIVLFAFRFFTTRNKEEISKGQGLFLFTIYLVYLLLNYV